MISFKSEKKEKNEMIRKETIKRRLDEDIIRAIYKMEDEFLSNPNINLAYDLIRKWQELMPFKFINSIPRGMHRMEPLYDFLNADKFYLKFRRERKKREALDLLERLRHDD